MMGILLNGYDLKKGFLLEKKFYIYKIRETALKDAYLIMGDSIKMMPTIFCDHSIKMMLLGPCITRSCQNKGQGSF